MGNDANREVNQDGGLSTSVETDKPASTQPYYKHDEENQLHAYSNSQPSPNSNLLDGKFPPHTDDDSISLPTTTGKIQPDHKTTQALARGDAAAPSGSSQKATTKSNGTRPSKGDKTSPYVEPNHEMCKNSASVDPNEHRREPSVGAAAALIDLEEEERKEKASSPSSPPQHRGWLKHRNHIPHLSPEEVKLIFDVYFRHLTEASIFYNISVPVQQHVSANSAVAERIRRIQSIWDDGGTTVVNVVSRTLAIIVSQAFGDIAENLRTLQGCKPYWNETSGVKLVVKDQLDTICEMVVRNIKFLKEISSKLNIYQCACENRMIDPLYLPWRIIPKRFKEWVDGCCLFSVHLVCRSCRETRKITAHTVEEMIILLALLLPAPGISLQSEDKPG